MRLFKIVLYTLYISASSNCFAGLHATSPSLLAAIEADTIARLTFQTGCAMPDLSDSEVDGTAVLDISFAQDGQPLGAEVISSNGSDTDNAKIVEALTKRCKYSGKLVTLPLGVNKQFTFKWKAHQDSSGLRGCRIYAKYPQVSIRSKEEGKAVVSYRYLADNSYESKISQSTSHPRLDDTTLTIINKCLDNRALKGSADTGKWNDVAMVWKLTGSEASSSSTQQDSASSSVSAQN